MRPLVYAILIAVVQVLPPTLPAAETPAPTPSATPIAVEEIRSYTLSPNDVVRIKVFQEEDLTTEMRLAKDGSGTFPLLGTINLGGKTVDEAAATVRDLLGKDYLVNP